MLHVLRGDHISVLCRPVSLIFLPLSHCLAFVYFNNVTLNSLGNTTRRQCLLTVQSCTRLFNRTLNPWIRGRGGLNRASTSLCSLWDVQHAIRICPKTFGGRCGVFIILIGKIKSKMKINFMRLAEGTVQGPSDTIYLYFKKKLRLQRYFQYDSLMIGLVKICEVGFNLFGICKDNTGNDKNM